MPGFAPRPVVLLLAGFLGGTSLGWISHRDFAPKPPASPEVPTLSIASPGAASGTRKGTLDGVESRKGSASDASESLRGSDPALPPSLMKFSDLVRGALKFPDYMDQQIRLREIMRAIPVEDLPATYLQAKKLGDSRSTGILSALGSRWAESDPRAAAEFALKLGSEDSMFLGNSMLRGVIGKWAATAPTEAVAWVEATPPSAYHDEMVVNALGSMQEKSPQIALQMLRRNATALNNWGNVASNFFSSWAARDPQTASAGALQMNGRLEEEAVNGVAGAWAEGDPRGALRWIDSLPKSLSRQNLVQSVARPWADKDPRAEIAWARGLTDEASRRAASTTGITRLASNDLSAALALIQSWPAGEDHDEAIRAAIQSAAQDDARGALQILDHLPAGPNRNALMQQVCATWGESEPRAALDWLMQNAPAGKGGYGLADLIQGWMTTAPEEAVTWAEALPAGDRRDSVMSKIVKELVKTDLDHAESLFAQLSPSAQGSAAGSIVNATLQESPEKACAWAQSLPEGLAQRKAYGELGQQWAAQDANAAAQWLGTLPEGKARDAAAASFSDSAFARDPEGALAWSQTISDPRDRDSSVEDLVRRWIESDSAAARKWLDANPQISADEKDRILNGAPRYGYSPFRGMGDFP